MLEQYLYRAIIRHLDGDREQFDRYAQQAHEMYLRDKHLYLTIGEIIEAKGA